VNIIELLDEAAGRTPDTAAIIDGPLERERVTTFSDLRRGSRQIASLLSRAGVGPGDGIVTLVPMSAPLYAMIAASLRIGAVPVFIDPNRATTQLERCRDALPLKAFVGSPMACLLRLLTPALRTIKPAFVTHGWFPGTTSLGAARRMPPIEHTATREDDAPAMLTFTSGSTGAAKGLLRSHRLLLSTQEILSRHLDLKPGSITLATMPNLVMANLGHGVTSYIPDVDLRHPAAADPARIASVIDRWGIESLLASPALVENLADHCLTSGRTLDSLRALFTGGAPVFPRILEKSARTCPRARVAALYGSTEAEPIALLSYDDITPADYAAIAEGAGLPAGRPVPEIRLRILEDHWGEPLASVSEERMKSLSLPAVARGEIVVSGPHVAPSYLRGQGEAESKFHAGETVWHRTGDSGWLDDRNRLWLTGRCAARVGEPPGAIYPFMVEAALADHPRLARAAFLSHRGKRLLVLELKRKAGTVDMEALMEALPWAGIDQVVNLPRIPLDRRHNAKIDYPALLAELAAP
jgi:acyl-CoA synthetase (AMP-forming)/AMP-acid ligase II